MTHTGNNNVEYKLRDPLITGNIWSINKTKIKLPG